MFEKLKNLDRRIIYIFVLLSVCIPLIKPLGLPISVSEETKRGFDAIDALPPGSRVLFSADYDPASGAEIYPMNIAILKHCFKKHLRVVAMGLWPQGTSQMDKAISEIKNKFPEIKYGVDYVNMGYKTGGIVVINGIGTNFSNIFPTDKHNTPIRELPILQDVKNYRSFSLIITLSAGTPGVKEWVALAGTKYNIPIVAGTTAVSVTELYPYYSGGQVTGLLNGLKGAAEYESIAGVPGKAITGMDAQSMAHIVIIVFIILGNIILFVEKRRAKK